MIEFGNISPYKIEPDYFYRVFENLTTFKADKGKNEPFTHTENFKGRDLLECKRKAEKYFYERSNGFQNNSYFLPFASPNNFEIGKNSVFTLILSFVEHYDEDYEIEHPLIGGEEEDFLEENRMLEAAVLQSKGISI